MFLKWELISSFELRHENSTIIDTNVEVKDVLVTLRSASNAVKVAKYKKFEWLHPKYRYCEGSNGYSDCSRTPKVQIL